ncbi:MAG: SDR family oxidoreductase, partial [Myxococcota bacterium]|nr:SDR family oxidoreductase [Myxococcota bacterium]
LEAPPLHARGRPVLVTGATGTLGRAFRDACAHRGLTCRVLSRSELDIADPASVSRVLHETEPWAVINAAGYTSVDRAERDPGRCYRENTWGATAMAKACCERGISLMTFSSDLVFDGARARPYVESDAPAPLSAFGWSKARAERAVLESHSSALVVRTSACFGPGNEANYVAKALTALRQRRAFLAPSDIVASPTYVPDLVRVALDLLVDGATGIWHLANEGAVTALELVRRIAGECGVPTRGLLPCSCAALGLAARRPAYSVLGSERGRLMPSLEDAIARYAQEQKQAWRAAGAA